MIDAGFWRGRRVLLTGHTGFKGAWCSILLRALGAEVYGYALEPATPDDLFHVAGVAGDVHHRIADVRDLDSVVAALAEARPHIVLHMAAQALVRPSYAEPVDTYATNVMGTVNVLEAVRRLPPGTVEAVVVVTSDKCYDNTGQIWGYRETDHLGGHDPYSNSKGCAELVTDAYRRSFFHTPGATRVASARAGNVIGGGDWSRDRLVPDAARAFLAGQPLRIRNPDAIRPWQHALDPVAAYLMLAERLAKAGSAFAGGWNFGPSAASEVPVRRIVEGLVSRWGGGARWEQDGGEHPHEAAYLKLDCTKAHLHLGWRPLLDLDAALSLTVEWFRAFQDGADLRALTLAQARRALEGAGVTLGA